MDLESAAPSYAAAIPPSVVRGDTQQGKTYPDAVAEEPGTEEDIGHTGLVEDLSREDWGLEGPPNSFLEEPMVPRRYLTGRTG